MRRIAMISDHASPLAAQGGVDSGGQNVYVAHLTRWLALRGFEVDVFTRRDSPELPEVVQWQPGARVVHVPAGPAQPTPKEELLPYMAEFTRFVRRVCRRRRYDLVHAHFWMSGLAALEIKRALDIPFVITFHALGRIRRAHQGDNDRFPDARFEIEERIAQSADRIIAECPQDRLDLLHHYGADPERISIVPCGFDPAELAPVPQRRARAALGLPRGGFLVLHLGRLVPRKGTATAIEGFARFVRATGADARLLIVGGESRQPDPALTPEIGRLRGVAGEQGIPDLVLFTGRRDRDVLRYYYSAADVFVTLPWYEPFGITPLEAMACAVPVVGSRVGGVKYTVQDGVTGCLVPPADAGALASCLARLHRDARLRRRMGRFGRARVIRHFTWARVAHDIEAAYAAVLAGRRRAQDDYRQLGAAAASAGSGASLPVPVTRPARRSGGTASRTLGPRTASGAARLKDNDGGRGSR
ncbi:MAG TPA: glycosyltransferase [Gammaproteobacteria bacterium]